MYAQLNDNTDRMSRTLRTSLPIALLLTAPLVMAQNTAINTTGAAPDPSAMLDITSTTDGLLIPRMLEAQRLTIPAPANGLMVYQTDDAVTRHGLWYYDATIPAWVRISDGIGWNTLGNAGTTALANYIGTSDATDFVMRTNNLERMRVLASGEVGINTNAPVEALHVNGGMRLFNPLAPNLSNQAGVIRYNPTTTFHEGNVTGTVAGWERLENAERLVLGDEYEGEQLLCGPGQATGSASTGVSTGPQNTPWPTGFRGAKMQYLFRGSELANLGLCPGNVTEVAFFVLDDDVQSPTPGAALNVEVTMGTTAQLNMTGGFDMGISALPPNGTLTNYVVGSGILAIPFATPYNWNGVDNVIIEVCWVRSTVTGSNPRVELTVGLPFAATRSTYDSFLNPGCGHANGSPATAVQGTQNNRPVVRFTGQALTPQPILAFGDYLNYNGGLLIGTAAWASSGVFQGPGVIRAENAVYDNGLELSDHVFDRYFDGAIKEEEALAARDHRFVELAELKDHLKQHRHLPNMPSREEWERNGKASLGELSTGLWETVEEQALYIGELEEQLRLLEDLAYGRGLTDGELHDLVEQVRNSRSLNDSQRERMIGFLTSRSQGTTNP